MARRFFKRDKNGKFARTSGGGKSKATTKKSTPKRSGPKKAPVKSGVPKVGPIAAKNTPAKEPSYRQYKKAKRKAARQKQYGTRGNRTREQKFNNGVRLAGTAIQIGVIAGIAGPDLVNLGKASAYVGVQEARRRNGNRYEAQARTDRARKQTAGFKTLSSGRPGASTIAGKKVRGGAIRITSAAPPRRGY